MHDHLLAEPAERAVAVAAAGACAAAAGLLPEGGGAWWATAPVLLAAIGSRRIGVAALPAALPAVALAGGGWPTWAGWSAAALAGALGITVWLRHRDEHRLRPLQRELRDAETAQADLERQLRRFPALIDACLALSGARAHDAFATLLVTQVRQVVPETASVQVFLGMGGAVDCRASADAQGQPSPREPGPDERYVAAESRGLIRREPGVVVLTVPLRADRRTPAGDGLRGVLAVRLAVGARGDAVGIELVHALARIAGIALAAVDLVDQARALALHDDLTGLFGRHEFLRRLDEQIARSRRAQRHLAVVLCDLDHLKRYNDRWGHPAGDAALRAVATALRTALPADGVACRWGGEEFCACASVPSPADLPGLGERLRAAISAAQPDPQHPERRVTASLGVALVRESEEGSATLERADAALYAAKAAGRDRVEVAP